MSDYIVTGYLSLDRYFSALPEALKPKVKEYIGEPLEYNPQVFDLAADGGWHPEYMQDIITDLMKAGIKVKVEALVVSDYGTIEYCRVEKGVLLCTGFPVITDLRKRIKEMVSKPKQLVEKEQKELLAQKKKQLQAEKKRIQAELKKLG